MNQDKLETPAETNNESSNPTESLQPFIEHLGHIFPAEIKRTGLRLLSKGLFVKEDLLNKIITAYQEWVQQNTGTARSYEKCLKHFFGSEEPELFYLVEGKLCVTGFMLNCSIPYSDKIGIQQYRGSLLDTKNFLHPKDPFFESLQGIVAVIDETAGFRVTINGKAGPAHVSPQDLTLVRTVISGNPKIQKQFKYSGTSLRFTLLALKELLNRARPVGRRHKTFIPSRFRNEKAFAFWKVGRLYLIFNRSSELKGVYELRGKNLHNFIRQEIDSLPKTEQRREKRDKKKSPGRPSNFLRLELQGQDTQLQHNFIARLVELVALHRDTPIRVPDHFTLLDCIKSFRHVANRSKLILSTDVPKAILSRLSGGETFLKSDRWILVVKNGTLVNLYLTRATKKARTEKLATQPLISQKAQLL